LGVVTEQDPVVKELKSDAELEDMILQRLLIGGVFVSVRRYPIFGWRHLLAIDHILRVRRPKKIPRDLVVPARASKHIAPLLD
jgi:hypothetical protein